MIHPIITARRIMASRWDMILPVDVSSIAAQLGISVCFVSMDDDRVSAIARVKNRKREILINHDIEMHRVCFSIAHAMYHLLNSGDRDSEFVDYAENYSAVITDPDEKAANTFASRIIAPEHAMKILVQRRGVTSVNELAIAFNCAPVLVNNVIEGMRWG
ncbi:ImmA/IrrE family metallo-endopeptidase [Aeromonas caviae]|uniref:ImmA/IrrE family metallo-endopeptidase n=1 Tax=Aeromonas caviae TaxID=648 RepID=UPI0038582357